MKNKPSPTKKRLYTVQQTGVYLGISDRTLWTLTNSGEIRSVRFGAGRRQSVRYDVADLDAWIESCKRGGKR